MPKQQEEYFYCSFCSKRNDDVEIMVAGAAVNICNVCIANCAAIAADGIIKTTKEIEEK